jgi:hypothetical protein
MGVPCPDFLYSFIPAVFGLLRIPELLGGPLIIPPNPRAVIDPVPIALHILGSSIFCLVGACSSCRACGATAPPCTGPSGGSWRRRDASARSPGSG